MRIIRPQQLTVLKNSYQLGRHCQMGISVIAGCYLSRPAHFVTEPQIWQAWKAAPLAFRMLDSAEPKPFAEFLLAGHAGIGEPVSALEVTAHVGPLTRCWQLQGERSQNGRLRPFLRRALDHCPGHAETSSDNPHPLMITAAQEKPPHPALLAPTPVPPDFPLRKKYLDRVAPLMRDQHYLETRFPGLPSAIDPRYFQLAVPTQWLNVAEWPDEVPFELVGFRPQYAALSGRFPGVRARAFIWQKGATAPEEVPLLRKTLWLLPDEDIGLMVFSGAIPLPHLFAEPPETLLVALDAVQALRDEAHYHQVCARRLNAQAAPFEFLNDPDLMPEQMAFNVIRDLADHPDSCRYSAAPLPRKEAARFYQEIQTAIALQQQLQARREAQREPAPPADADALPLSPPADAGTAWLQSGAAVAENITFTATDFSGRQLRDKRFRRCIFERCCFDHSELTHCRFDYCRFQHTSHQHAVMTQVRITDSFFQHSCGQQAQFARCEWEKVTMEATDLQTCALTDCLWQHNIITRGDFSACRFDRCRIRHSCFTAATLKRSQHQQGEILACLFEQCDAQHSAFSDSLLKKNSLIGGDWEGSRFLSCTLESVTTGLGVNLCASRYEQCQMAKMGFYRARLQHSQFIRSALQESCCDKADLSQTQVTACDMPGLRLREAVLTHATWTATSLQQGMLYHADLRDATFSACNLAGACMAMVSLNAASRFERCLMEQVQWLPRRRVTA